MQKRTCDVCGVVFSQSAGRPAKRCSEECRGEASRRRYPSRGSYQRSCDLCGESFTTNQPRRRWCGDKCRERGKKGYAGGRDRIMDSYECEWCGRLFGRSAAQRHQRFCDLGHRKAYKSWRTRETPFACPIPSRKRAQSTKLPAKSCAWCAEAFTPRRSTHKFCGAACRTAQKRNRSRVWYRECGACGDLFTTSRKNSRWCSKACRKARHKWPISPKKRLKVLERDGYVCHLCDEPTDPDDFDVAVGSDGRECIVAGGRYPSIDHVVPKSLGGGHEVSNLRTAHRDCNSERGVELLEVA